MPIRTDPKAKVRAWIRPSTSATATSPPTMPKASGTKATASSRRLRNLTTKIAIRAAIEVSIVTRTSCFTVAALSAAKRGPPTARSLAGPPGPAGSLAPSLSTRASSAADASVSSAEARGTVTSSRWV